MINDNLNWPEAAHESWNRSYKTTIWCHQRGKTGTPEREGKYNKAVSDQVICAPSMRQPVFF